MLYKTTIIMWSDTPVETSVLCDDIKKMLDNDRAIVTTHGSMKEISDPQSDPDFCDGDKEIFCPDE